MRSDSAPMWIGDIQEILVIREARKGRPIEANLPGIASDLAIIYARLITSIPSLIINEVASNLQPLRHGH